MKITNNQQFNFGYKSILKTEWLNGNMPTVKYDMGGNLLTAQNITLGHMQPHSKRGSSGLANFMLETKRYNNNKGNMPFSSTFSQSGFDSYCKQFEGINLKGFNGDGYVQMITKTAKRLLRQGK